jgi:response regulator RpfG family c-di-GMP phosphodiesterase
MSKDDELVFVDEFDSPSTNLQRPWKVMIVDDEQAVHEVTLMALAGFEFDGRPVEFISCYSGKEARIKLHQHSDIALIMLDVVMEQDDAGLLLVRYIREEMHNKLTRIVLRTGQPGQAPEKNIIVNYDINDYKEKTELTATKLFTMMYSSLRAYRDIKVIEDRRLRLKHIIDASAEFFRLSSLECFAKEVLDQLSTFIQTNPAALCIKKDTVQGVALTFAEQGWRVISGSGKYVNFSNAELNQVLPKLAIDKLDQAQHSGAIVLEEGYLVCYFEDKMGHKNALIFEGVDNLSNLEQDLIELFMRNISVCFENIHLNNELDESQKEIIYLLGSAVEFRSHETGNHVKRVAEVCYVLGIHSGLSEYQAQILKQASPLHDLGKIGIPDAILNKPGQLDAQEKKIMMSHVDIGHTMLSNSNRELLQAAAIIALEHHECWDGSGYPLAKRDEQIHLYGRIAALADVSDALLSRRCYKEPWPLEQVLQFLREQKGKRFDPRLVDLFFEHLDEVLRIRDANLD